MPQPNNENTKIVNNTNSRNTKNNKNNNPTPLQNGGKRKSKRKTKKHRFAHLTRRK
jgi:hypothetical protein